jgi:hypothetical protein
MPVQESVGPGKEVPACVAAIRVRPIPYAGACNAIRRCAAHSKVARAELRGRWVRQDRNRVCPGSVKQNHSKYP